MLLQYTAERECRLSALLKGEMRMSSGLVNRLKWQDRLFVNGVPRHTDYPVTPGDVVTVLLDEEEPAYPPQDGPLSILYEDDYLLAVDKPAGMLIHPSRVRFDGTLANFVLGYYRKTGQKSAFHPVTRLDRDTYGIVLLAKNSYAHALLTELQEAGQIRKYYHALVLGGPQDDRGIIDAPIARKPLPSLLREVRPDGKESVTEYRVLERGKILCKLELCPITGRTHQLRVHCAYCGFPILGDPQYGTEACLEFSLPGQALCAKRLEFPHPVTGQPMILQSRMEPEVPGIWL